MNQIDPDIQKIMEEFKTIRKENGYCPSQKRSKDGVLYCNALRPWLDEAHAYCQYLGTDKIRIVEEYRIGDIRSAEYFISKFMPTSNE